MPQAHPHFSTLCDAIALIDGEPKPVSSSQGHQLMEHSPFASARYRVANQRAQELLTTILPTGDRWAFLQLAEAEALALHGLMLLSPRNPIHC